MNIKIIFLRALEESWKTEKKKGLKNVDRKNLIDTAMAMLGNLGDKSITKEDIGEIIDKVWGKE